MRGKLWNFIRPADPKKVMRFENTGEDFSAMYQAQHWLHDNGYCYGSSDWIHYIPAMKGDRYTLPQKLYNFDREDYDQVSAVMYSLDYRNGWVEVWLVEQGMTVLDLVLTYKWYDMIESGEKREEYREITPYWIKRLVDTHRLGQKMLCNVPNVAASLIESGCVQMKSYTHVRFHRGYTAKSMVFRFDGLRIGNGNTQWGAPADRDVFIISLGERYK